MTEAELLNEEIELDVEDIPDSEGGYKWRGIDGLGREFKLVTYAKTAKDAERELIEAGIEAVSIRPKTLAIKKRHLPKEIELAAFARNFGEQIESGNTPQQIIKMLADAEVNQTMAEALIGANIALQNGRQLFESFEIQRDEKDRTVFPKELISAFDIGEAIGAAYNHETGKKESGLLVTLRRFAEGQEKADYIKARIKSAMYYPVAVLITAIAATVVVSLFVMPQLKGFYESLLQGKNTQLPLPTRALIFLSEFAWSWMGLFTLIGIIAAGAIFIKWWKSPRGQEFKGRHIIFLPYIGNFYRMLYASQLLRYLAMLAAGISDIKQQMSLAAETCENPVFREMLENIAYQYRIQGKALTPMFKPYLYLFGQEFLSSLLTADQTGDPSGPYTRYAQMLEIRVNRQLDGVLKTMENVIIFPLAAIVGGLVVSIVMPFFEIAGRLAGN